MGLNYFPDEYYRNDQNSAIQDYTKVDLDSLIEQFYYVYVGEDKIIPRARKVDVQFHAMRAIQELNYDTLNSYLDAEYVVPPSLRIKLPQDFVNHTKIGWSDDAGIIHPLYPVKGKTKNPQSININQITNDLQESADGFTLDTGFSFSETPSGTSTGAISGRDVAIGNKISIPLNFDIKNNERYYFSFDISNDQLTPGISGIRPSVTGALRVTVYGPKGFKFVQASDNRASSHTGTGTATNRFVFSPDNYRVQAHTEDITNTIVIESTTVGNTSSALFNGSLSKFILFRNGEENQNSKNLISKTFSKYRSYTPSDNMNRYDDGTYDLVVGERYGLDPEHAQVNGTYYISNGYIYLSSNVAGKTLVLCYISDGLNFTGRFASNSTDRIYIHKFAEEAMYKHIMYALASGRADVPEYVIRRLKKERFAETRKAKLRLSNMKIEEITQTLRGKSKWIKH
tara:strand:- start:6709 stop:8076 length:1368 start_codon:yes stop_codon:yes gene_type:complete